MTILGSKDQSKVKRKMFFIILTFFIFYYHHVWQNLSKLFQKQNCTLPPFFNFVKKAPIAVGKKLKHAILFQRGKNSVKMSIGHVKAKKKTHKNVAKKKGGNRRKKVLSVVPYKWQQNASVDAVFIRWFGRNEGSCMLTFWTQNKSYLTFYSKK